MACGLGRELGSAAVWLPRWRRKRRCSQPAAGRRPPSVARCDLFGSRHALSLAVITISTATPTEWVYNRQIKTIRGGCVLQRSCTVTVLLAAPVALSLRKNAVAPHHPRRRAQRPHEPPLVINPQRRCPQPPHSGVRGRNGHRRAAAAGRRCPLPYWARRSSACAVDGLLGRSVVVAAALPDGGDPPVVGP